MKNIIITVVIILSLVIISGCVQTLDEKRAYPSSVENTQQKMMKPSGGIEEMGMPVEGAKEQPVQQQKVPLMPKEYASGEECISQWEATLKENKEFISIDSNGIIVQFEDGVSLEVAKQTLRDQGFDPIVHNVFEEFPKDIWSDYTEEELYEFSGGLKAEVEEGTEVAAACSLHGVTGVAQALPNVFINFFQQAQ